MESQWFRFFRAWTLERERLHLCFHVRRNSPVLDRKMKPLGCATTLLTVHTFPFRSSVSCPQKLLQKFIRKQQPFPQQPYCEQITSSGGGVFFPFRRSMCGTWGNAKSAAAGNTPSSIWLHPEPPTGTCLDVSLQTQTIMLFKIKEQSISIVLFFF